jgi:hypothetical protein
LTTERQRLSEVREAPGSAAAWSALGRWYLDHGSPDVARLCGGRSQALDPADQDALLLEAATTDPRRVGPAVARDLFSRAINAGVRHPFVDVNLCLLRLMTGDESSAARHLHQAVAASPHDLTVRRALRAALIRMSLLYRIVSLPRQVADWVRARLGRSFLGFLPVLEAGFLTVTVFGIMHNPFDTRQTAAILGATWMLTVWWPLVAGIEALAGLRLRSSPPSSGRPEAPREAVVPGSSLLTALVVAAALAAILLGQLGQVPLYLGFMSAYVDVNCLLLACGLLLTELVRRSRGERRRRRVYDLARLSVGPAGDSPERSTR